MKKLYFGLILLTLSTYTHAAPVKIVSLTPQYNSEVVQIMWESSLGGGCSNSNIANTNPAAINHKKLVSFLLTALTAQIDVEVIFGGGCDSQNQNWIQTIRLLK